MDAAVRRMRPHYPWEKVVRVLGDRWESWPVVWRRRVVGKLVAQPRVDPTLRRPAPWKSLGDRPMMLVAAVTMADPVLARRDIGGPNGRPSQEEATRRCANDRAGRGEVPAGRDRTPSCAPVARLGGLGRI